MRSTLFPDQEELTTPAPPTNNIGDDIQISTLPTLELHQ